MDITGPVFEPQGFDKVKSIVPPVKHAVLILHERSPGCGVR